jgi:hypothetical protein
MYTSGKSCNLSANKQCPLSLFLKYQQLHTQIYSNISESACSLLQFSYNKPKQEAA